MRPLVLAGMISGAGNAAEKSLGKIQDTAALTMLLEKRNEMENLRQDKMLAAQKGMHTESLEATRTENVATRAQAKELAGEAQTFQHGENVDTRTAAAENTDKTIAANKEIHEGTNQAQKEIHKATNDTTLAVAQIHEKATSKATNAAEITALVKLLGDKRADLRQIKRDLLDPMKNDPNSMFVKSLLDEVDMGNREIEQAEVALNARLNMPPTTPRSAAPGINLGKYGGGVAAPSSAPSSDLTPEELQPAMPTPEELRPRSGGLIQQSRVTAPRTQAELNSLLDRIRQAEGQ